MRCPCVGTWKAPCLKCYREELVQRQAEPEPSKQELNIQLRKVGVPESVLSALAAPLVATDALAHARAFLALPKAQGQLLALLGSTGRGKSVAAGWAMRETLKRMGWNNTATGGNALPVEFVEASRLTRVSSFDKLDGQWLDILESVPLLVIDDAGDEATASGTAGLATLLLSRSNKHRRSVITSNLRREAFEVRYGKALMDRALNFGIVAELAGKSLRAKPETRAP